MAVEQMGPNVIPTAPAPPHPLQGIMIAGNDEALAGATAAGSLPTAPVPIALDRGARVLAGHVS